MQKKYKEIKLTAVKIQVDIDIDVNKITLFFLNIFGENSINKSIQINNLKTMLIS